MSLAAKLKELRQKKGQSLQQVGDGVGVSKAHIWELERGSSTNPGKDLLAKLASHFGVTVAFLLDESAEPKEAAALQFFREFDGKLSEKDWDMLRVVAERLKDKDG
ncbi:helix-turn-helix domain-containing protein [Nitrospirillum bahiense]|uniref:Transcriptional regulator with XRE-family HTH domain n=1 Tax=Nitrospirillum amazonense TaxID=28077 RepID=A0A560FHN4_9PROT|nr:helix-turn-helix transcriptional regulator [Nitrospirillum amazonense]TWB21123.1 transcriptional regulator with XRE-family HTH domain [Nitrospirillum amazonense]